jgi:hypothetical protein
MARKLLIVSGLIAATAALGGLYYLVQIARNAALETTSHGRLYYLMTAIHHYQDRHGHLPRAADGAPPVSWRVALLAELSSLETYKQYDRQQPWNSPANQAVAGDDSLQRMFCWPEESYFGTATYLAVVGPNTLWPEQGEVRGEGAALDRLLLVEYPESKIPWTQPRDLTVAEVEALLAAGHELRYITLAGRLGVLRAKDPRPW